MILVLFLLIYEYKEFFGCLPSDDTELLEMEHREWLGARTKLTTAEKAMPMVHYWSQPSVKGKYPTLFRLALWYSNRPTSNVACERAFAIMRSFTGGLQWSLTEDSVEEILMAKVNTSVSESLLDVMSVRLAKAVKSGSIASSNSSSSSSASSASSR